MKWKERGAAFIEAAKERLALIIVYATPNRILYVVFGGVLGAFILAVLVHFLISWEIGPHKLGVVYLIAANDEKAICSFEHSNTPFTMLECNWHGGPWPPKPEEKLWVLTVKTPRKFSDGVAYHYAASELALKRFEEEIAEKR